MSETHVISALVAKRAELSGLILDLDKRRAAIKAQLHHIDHSLAIFGYKDAPRAIKPISVKVYKFGRRELPALMRRFANQGDTNRDIALAIMEYKQWDRLDRDLVCRVTESVKGAKNWQSRKARVALSGE